MNVLIVGGAGYIGSHVVKELQRGNEFNPIVYDNLKKGHRDAVKKCSFIQGDINNYYMLDQTVKNYKIGAVMHFAADSLVGESMKKPDQYYKNNVANAITLLDIMRENNIKYLVFSSTAAVYGEPDRLPISEDLPTRPNNVYGRTKLIIEEMLNDYSLAYDLKFMSLRYFNACGADLSGEIGEDHTPETHLIPLVLYTAMGKRDSINVYGTDYLTKDGTCIRDYIHVNDLALAHILALKALLRGSDSKIYNLGNGYGYSVLDVIKTSKEITGIDFKVIDDQRRIGDPAILVASSSKIMKELGWYPQMPNLKEIIKSAWNWHKYHPNGFNDKL